jgi:uncharacterized protein YuzE
MTSVLTVDPAMDTTVRMVSTSTCDKVMTAAIAAVTKMPNLEIDENADAAYIQLTDAEITYSDEIANGIVFDYDEYDKVVGIEILHLSKRGN